MFLFPFSGHLFLLLIINIFGVQLGSSQEYSPCPTNALLVQRKLNGPPGKANNWHGRVSLSQWNLPYVELVITLDNTPKTLVVKDEYGQVTLVNGGYKITYLQPSSSVNLIHFVVKGHPTRGFPNPTGLFLNGVDICRNGGPIGPRAPSRGSTNTVQTSGTNSICGRRQIYHQGLITYGYPTNEGEWPWHAALYLRASSDSSRYICGGTLISSETVLTAGHCLVEGGHSITPDRLIVKLGLHNRAVANSHTQEYPVFNTLLHENFDYTSLKHDIAVLKLSHRVIFNNYIQPACLWPRGSIPLESVIGHNGIILGWGLDERDQLSSILKAGTMPVVSPGTCLQSNPTFFSSLISNFNFCAGYRNGTSVCNGDSGGGMFFKIGSSYYIRGIVSLAVAQDNKAVCNPRHYAVFTDVAKHIDWIDSRFRRRRK